MILRYLFLLLTVFVTTIFLDNEVKAQGESLGEVTVEVNKQTGRIYLPSMEVDRFVVNLCDLEKGEKYYVQSSLDDGRTLVVLENVAGGKLLNEKHENLIEVAENCLSLRFYIPNRKGEVYPILSFDRESKSKSRISSRSANAIQVENGLTAEQLVRDVLIGGNCFDVHNIQAIGPNSGKGVFRNGMASIGIDEGIVFSTGFVDDILGPNESHGTSGRLSADGDDDLMELVGSSLLRDAVGVQFDFIPTADSVRFRYVFASEEYCEFVNANFNDVFGFFISGPGINGTFSNNARNLAIIPNSGDYVSINNVNRFSNSQFYFDNTPEDQEQDDPTADVAACGPLLNEDGVAIELIEFDGFTAVFEAVVMVEACETYTIKMVVGDVQDAIYDSAVFLEAGSFDAGASAQLETEVEGVSGNVVYDECLKGNFVLSRIGNSNRDDSLVIRLNFSDQSSAEPGVDFEPLPDSIVIPPFQDSIVVPVDILTDTYSGGELNIIYELEFLCSCSNPFAEIIINDPNLTRIDAEVVDFISCSNREVLLQGEILMPEVITEVEWQDMDGTVLGNVGQLSVMVSQAGDYRFIGYNEESGCGDTVVVSVEVDQDVPVVEIASPTIINCIDSMVTLDGSGSSSGPDIVYQWASLNGIIVSGENSNSATVSSGGTYTLEVINTENGCATLDSVRVEEDLQQPEIIISTPEVLSCQLREIQLDASETLNQGSIDFNWSTSTGGILSDRNEPEVTINEAGFYQLDVTWQRNGCSNTGSIEVFQDLEQPEIDAGEDQLLPCDNPLAMLRGSVDGAVADFQFSWSTPNGEIVGPSDSSSIEASATGNYFLWVLNLVNGCESVDSVEVFEELPTDIDLDIVQPICPGDVGVVMALAVEGGNFPYTYEILELNNSQNQEGIFEGLIPGVYTVEVTDVNGCVTNRQIEIESPREIEVFLPERDTAELGESYQMEVGLNFPEDELGFVQWTPSENLSCSECLEPMASVTGETLFSLYIEDENGCPAEGEMFLVINKEPSVFVPNAFSPNGDGINDRLVVFTDSGVAEILDFQVFDRWGNRVFDQQFFSPNEENFGWDGTVDGVKSPSQVYVFTMSYRLVNGEFRTMTGEISLIR